MKCITKDEHDNLLKCYINISEPSILKEDVSIDEYQLIKKYEMIDVVNIYLETVNNPMSHLYRAQVDGDDISIQDNNVRITGYDNRENVNIALSITEHMNGNERVSVNISRNTNSSIDGPWEDDNIIFRNRERPNELNVLITKAL